MAKSKEINLAEAKIPSLIAKFALPAILANLVGSIYNIVDQIFIGQNLGTNGNAATGAGYPLILLMTAIYILFGAGAASKFSLYQGEGKTERAGKIIGNSVLFTVIAGVVLMAITEIFLSPLLSLFGAEEEVLPLATEYMRILAIGMPFQMFGAGAAMIIRADKSPNYAMLCTLSGAVLNIGLDALFILAMNLGMTGAALATIIGQIVSAALAFAYFFRFKTLKIKLSYFKPSGSVVKEIVRLGLPAGLMQVGVMVAQVVMNKSLVYYGKEAGYGSSVPLAVNDVVAKVTAIFSATTLGIAQSCQPILGYNYGAKNYKRVRKTFFITVICALCVSMLAFILFQTIPHWILWIFNSHPDDERYFEFGELYLRIFMGATFLSSVPIAVSNFFPSIGKGGVGILASLAQRIIFQLPLVLILPLFWGLYGIFYAGCAADVCAAVLCVILVWGTIKKLGQDNEDNATKADDISVADVEQADGLSSGE